MKTRNIFLLALTAILGVSCHSWDEPAMDAGQDSYGNQYIQETNVVTIDALKTQYKSVIKDNSLQQITKPTQIKVIVTGNDEGSNLYKQLYVSDGTGSLYMSIDKSGIFSEAAVGQCMLIELEGLYIGAYGQQPEIGTFYHNDSKNTDQVGRMSRYTWQDHFKLISPIEGLSAKPEEVVSMNTLDIEKDCGKLVTLVGVKMKDADGKNTFAPSDGSAQLVGGCVNRNIDGMSNVVVRTSTYAKYAAMVMPTDPIDITGIAARYGNTWQIMPRTQDDIKKSTHEPITPPAPAGTGTKDDPYNVAGVLAYVESLGADKESPNDVYFSGVITSITQEFDTNFGSATFVISDNEMGLNSFTIYRGYYLNNKKFTASDTQIKKGDKVVICGKVINYKGTTPETSQNKAYIYSLNSGGGDTPAETIGTKDAPLTIAQALEKINALEDGKESELNAYVKGKVVKVTTTQANFEKYGNLNYLISEDGTETNTITVYSGDGLDGAKFTGIDALAAGDEVIVFGKLYKYVKNDKVTPEIAKGNYLVSLVPANGGTGGGGNTQTGNTGTLDNPLTASQVYDIVAAMDKDVNSTEDYYVKGKICSIKFTFSADYGTATFNISDDGNTGGKEFTAYGTYYHASEQKWVEGDTQVAVGDEVVVCGKVVNFKGSTPEFANKKSYVVTINGK